MPTRTPTPRTARSRTWTTLCLTLTLSAWLASCAAPGGPPPAASPAVAAPAPAVAAAPPPVVVARPAAAPAPAAPPPPILPFDEAVLSAANNLLGKAQFPGSPAPGGRHVVIIDPLIDGVTGAQTQASRAMGARIVKLIRDSYATQYEVQAFTSANVARAPLVLVGTFTGVNGERKTEGKREAFRICLALADLKTGKLVSKGLAFAQTDGVDTSPLPYFRDAPAWADDPATTGYIRTCQGTRAGDPIHPLYVERIATASTLAEATEAYGAGKYVQALKLYQSALTTPSGQQLRTYTGLYLSNWRLGKREAAGKAFSQIVDQGLQTKRLGVKFLFKPGTAALWSDPKAGAASPYSLWLSEIASGAAKRNACMEVVGHTSATGPEPMNERLSLLRAEGMKAQVERAAPVLARRLIANGVGSRETMVGNGRDDTSDALDRRVEFKVVGC